MRTSQDIERAVRKHRDDVWRACVMRCSRVADAEDAFQTTFLKYSQHEGVFRDDEHSKAWLLRVAINASIDLSRKSSVHDASMDTMRESGYEPCDSSGGDVGVREVLDAMHDLGDPPESAVYLSLYEGYSAPEIAKILDVPVNTVYSWIARGKKRLQEVLS